MTSITAGDYVALPSSVQCPGFQSPEAFSTTKRPQHKSLLLDSLVRLQATFGSYEATPMEDSFEESGGDVTTDVKTSKGDITAKVTVSTDGVTCNVTTSKDDITAEVVTSIDDVTDFGHFESAAKPRTSNSSFDEFCTASPTASPDFDGWSKPNQKTMDSPTLANHPHEPHPLTNQSDQSLAIHQEQSPPSPNQPDQPLALDDDRNANYLQSAPSSGAFTPDAEDVSNLLRAFALGKDSLPHDSFKDGHLDDQRVTLDASATWRRMMAQFGGILPIEWARSASCRFLSRVLTPSTRQLDANRENPLLTSLEDDDDSWGDALDYHDMVTSLVPLAADDDVVFGADYVIKDIDAIYGEEEEENILDIEEAQGGGPSIDTPLDAADSPRLPLQQISPGSSHDDQRASTANLNKVIENLERKIKENSETLIELLAQRDELEDEKDIKNEFISLLLSIQTKRHPKIVPISNTRLSLSKVQIKEQKSQKLGNKRRESAPPVAAHYDRSAVVPFDADVAVDVPLLRVFIKILGAIREDSPLVPALLTDYILKVLCPNDVAAGPRGAPIDIVSL